jgi:plasmid stability protein
MGEISIKGISDYQIEQLHERARRNHRTLEAELRALIDFMVPPQEGSITIEELGSNARRLGLSTPSEAVRMIREDRDSR